MSQSGLTHEMTKNLYHFDFLLRQPDDQPIIGFILYKTQESFVAECALRDIIKPIRISEYQFASVLPDR